MTSYVETDERMEYPQFAFKFVYIRVSLQKAGSYFLYFLKKKLDYSFFASICVCVFLKVFVGPL